MHSGFTEKYYDELQFCEDLVEQYRGKKELNMAAKIKCYRFIIRLLRMSDLPAADYSILLPKAKRCYSSVKIELSVKDRVKFQALSHAFLRRIYLKVKK